MSTVAIATALDDLPDGDANVVVGFADVGLRGLAPASIEQRLSGGLTGRRWPIALGGPTSGSVGPTLLEPGSLHCQAPW
jgi:hypothetical protein